MVHWFLEFTFPSNIDIFNEMGIYRIGMTRCIVTLADDKMQESSGSVRKGGKGYRIKYAQILLKLDRKPENKDWT